MGFFLFLILFLFNILIIIASIFFFCGFDPFGRATCIGAATFAMLDGVSDVENAVMPLPLA
jgi:hypothetical protein